MPLQLVLVSRRDPSARASFEDLARRVMAEAPDIRARVILDGPNRPTRLRLLPHRTLVVSPKALRHFRPLRGAVTQGLEISKARELQRLEAAGVPIPRWTLLDGPDGGPLPELGPWVVSKPNLGGNRGKLVRIVEASGLRWRPRYAERGGVVIQEFVYTGPWPVAYRVLTLFGEPLFAARMESTHDREPLRHRHGFGGGGNPTARFPILASARSSRWTLTEDEEMLALARQAATALPDVPLLGVDLVRDVETGRCYVLETNPNGRTWLLASATGRSIERANGIDLASQRDAPKRAARVLAVETRRRAR